MNDDLGSTINPVRCNFDLTAYFEVLETYQGVMQQWGRLFGIRDLGTLESAIAQPYTTFDENEFYPCLAEKAAALGSSLIQNHPFRGGDKRTGHTTMESFLEINGFNINARTDEQVDVILSVASGKPGREDFTEWLSKHIQELPWQTILLIQAQRVPSPKGEGQGEGESHLRQRRAERTKRQTDRICLITTIADYEEESCMAHKVQAWATCGPRIEPATPMTDEEVIEDLVNGTNQSRGSTLAMLAELDAIIERALAAGRIVQLPNGMHFRPTMRRDGSIAVSVRVNPDVVRRLNARFHGKVRNAENAGKSEAEIVALWNADHPNDPVER